MEEKHISQEEWTQFFSSRQMTARQMTLRSRILMHTERCADCRGIYEKGLALRNAAQAWSALEASPAEDGDVYRAVASAQDAKAVKKKGGSLTVDIDAGMGCFMEETLDTTGCANKYALNLEDDGACLVDDGGELTLVLEDGTVRVLIPEGAMTVAGQLLTEEGRSPLVFTQGMAQATLPPDDFCTLELFFSE